MAVSRKAGSMARGGGKAGAHGCTEQNVCSRQDEPLKLLRRSAGETFLQTDDQAASARSLFYLFHAWRSLSIRAKPQKVVY